MALPFSISSAARKLASPRLIKRNYFIGEIYIQSIMVAMSADVKSLSFLLFSLLFTPLDHSFIMQKSHLGEQRYTWLHIYPPDTYRYRYRKRT